MAIGLCRGGWLLVGLLLFHAVAQARTPDRAVPLSPEKISFNEHIRPILSENCFACHGPDSGNREAGLRLDRAAAATAELDSGMRAIRAAGGWRE